MFLNHLTSYGKSVSHANRVRLIGKFPDSKIENEKVTRFPDEHVERLIYLGFEKNGVTDFKSQAITMLLNYGGLRKSEVFHVYTSDITQNPNRNDEALVWVYHPEYGASPDAHYKSRKEYLLAQSKYKSRNKYRLSERLYAGWKSPLLISKDSYFEVVFSPPIKPKNF